MDSHTTNELLHIFDALVIRIWELVLQYDDLGSFAVDVSDGDGNLDDIINSKVDILIERYLVTDNLDQFNGTISRNAALFVRDMLAYMELSSAIKAGEDGRIQEVIKVITTLFQAGATTNYANELLHLHCGLSYSWTEKN
ncbi:hypothetical protein BGZ65_004457 [Modicella reniformis]|uniref:DUF6589 domain-containing protein n=1 Tax=Modicella reniformis TaxID=1440133 RepID=A0A9P6MHQ3_9FUNG|nr:hypothetical protein BGZ65_004457 [Modicella reniformis]